MVKTFTMSGTVVVAYGKGDLNVFVVTGSILGGTGGVGLRKEGSLCTSPTGPEDVGPGTQATVTDERGTVVGVSALGDGAFVTKVVGAPSMSACVFKFTVPAVPYGRAFYGVAVARHGVVQFTQDQAKAPVLAWGS